MNLNSKIPDSPDNGGEKPPPRQLTEAERRAVRAEHWGWIRYIALSAADGAALGALLAVLIIRFNFHEIGDMLAASPHATGYTLMLIVGMAHTFGMVAAGTAIWLRATQEKD